MAKRDTETKVIVESTSGVSHRHAGVCAGVAPWETAPGRAPATPSRTTRDPSVSIPFKVRPNINTDNTTQRQPLERGRMVYASLSKLHNGPVPIHLMGLNERYGDSRTKRR
ncbi:hypothetical protein EVAR_49991_1 [Eumeta japonica]|uniref:Uncharacterized protein n=1 Tax=Eumeta variegata TaxID=151549 RepID=A0A4C1XRJ6_EUMVA|nr:hypothetical protein EVAR_49991_1 [Eumeta japonica]